MRRRLDSGELRLLRFVQISQLRAARQPASVPTPERAYRRLSQVRLPKVLVERGFYGVDMSPREHLALTADLVHGDGLRCSP